MYWGEKITGNSILCHFCSLIDDSMVSVLILTMITDRLGMNML